MMQRSTGAKGKKFNKKYYTEMKLRIKLHHVLIECVTVCGHDCFA